MLTAACYARKSTQEKDKEVQAKSVHVQADEARRFAERKGWRFLDAHVYTDDAVSGVIEDRPGLSGLLAAIEGKAKPFDVLIISEQSRLGRDLVFTLGLIRRIEEAGVKIVSYLDDRPVSMLDDSGEIEQVFRAVSGSQERRKASQRTHTVARRMVERGKRHGGKLYGFVNAPKVNDDGTVTKTVSQVPAEVEAIRFIFAERATGTGLFRIGRMLDERGILPPSASRKNAEKRGRGWYASQLQNVIRNTSYRGTITWGKTRRVKRKGQVIFEKSPENVISTPAPEYRIIDDKTWYAANAISDQSASNTWRDKAGRLKSRATNTSGFLLSPFIACPCGSPMHPKQSGRGDKRAWLYTCTRRHLLGKKGCTVGGRGIRVEYLDRAILQSFEEGLIGHTVMAQVQEVLSEQKARAIDPKPLEADVKRLKAEIKRLTDALASGELEDIHEAVRTRKARLEHLEGTLSGLGAVQEFDLSAFAEKVTPVIADWQAHLKKNHATAAQVLRKLIPHRLTIHTEPGGGWRVQGDVEYSALLRECGFSVVENVLNEVVAKKNRSRARREPRRAR
jgi:site-specific DNA recombinase